MEREWLTTAGLRMPPMLTDPKDITRPVIVKYHGAKGGRGFFIARNYVEFSRKIQPDQEYTIQEFTLGTRYYLHYFFSPIVKDGYRVRDGSLQMLSIDRRDETNIDEAHRLGSIQELEEIGIPPSFVVTGNIPMVIRESLLPKVFDMGERVVKRAYEMFGGIWGPFCLETVVTDDLEITTFEISGRIVAGTNPFVSGSPYADLVQPGLSTGQRIAQELVRARKEGRLGDILT
jgi:5-formaminoimidazole-4-carboxamide-1-(beta)-D-ribofuranosyl 5'-monophosphate synthetase